MVRIIRVGLLELVLGFGTGEQIRDGSFRRMRGRRPCGKCPAFPPALAAAMNIVIDHCQIAAVAAAHDAF